MKDPVLAWNQNLNVQSVTCPFNDKNVPAFRSHLQTHILLFETCQSYNSILDRKCFFFLLFHYIHNQFQGPSSLFPTQKVEGSVPVTEADSAEADHSPTYIWYRGVECLQYPYKLS